MWSDNFKHVVILCTLNRENSVFRLLESLRNTQIGIELLVICVESSNDFEYHDRISKSIKQSFNQASEVIYDPGGLPTCRNLAISKFLASKSAGEKLVHFFDDDITVETNYFSQAEYFFEVNKGVAGGGPRIADLYLPQKNSNRFLEFLGSSEQGNFGKITRSGKNYWFPDISSLKSASVDWIPGCCMIFRSVVLEKFRFNINLEKGPGQNYALGEDAEFTWRVSKYHDLAFIPSMRITHYLAPSKRDDMQLMLKGNAIWTAYLYRLTYGRVRIGSVLLSQLIEKVGLFCYQRFRIEGFVMFLKLNFYRGVIFNVVLFFRYVVFFFHELISRTLKTQND